MSADEKWLRVRRIDQDLEDATEEEETSLNEERARLLEQLSQISMTDSIQFLHGLQFTRRCIERETPRDALRMVKKLISMVKVVVPAEPLRAPRKRAPPPEAAVAGKKWDRRLRCWVSPPFPRPPGAAPKNMSWDPNVGWVPTVATE